ncbi:MAG: hypothetical protein ACR2MB_08540 [Acidimicrobiales bacterium]
MSNLTNLIVAERFNLGVGDFLSHLAVPSIAATAVGYWSYRSVFRLDPTADPVDAPGDPRALRRGVPVIAFVLLG